MTALQELLLRHKPTLDPSRETSSGVLCERVPALTFGNDCIGVDKQSRRQEYDCAAREANDDVEVPQDEVTTFVRVEVSKRNNGAPTGRYIQVVGVRNSARLRTEVERNTGKDAVGEVATNFRIVVADRSQHPSVLLVEVIGRVLKCR